MRSDLNAKPNQPTWWQVFGKIIIWIIIWAIIAALLLIILTALGWTNFDLQNDSNPILSLLLIVAWFLSSFIGNLWVVLLYSLFFSKEYNKMNKSIWVLLLTNWILFVFLLPIYWMFNGNLNTLFMILWFHIIIATFLSSQQIENMRNPNYSASSLIWNTLSLAITMLVYGIFWKFSTWAWALKNQLHLLLLVPPIIAFGIIPLWLWIWDAIYFKFFEMWNDLFYAESKWELNKEELEYLEKEESMNEIEDDINVDLK